MPAEFYAILWSAVGVIVSGLASWGVATLVAWLNGKIKDQKLARWSTAVLQIIFSAVQTVFQEFVEVMKKEGTFTEAAQKEAKERAYAIIVGQLSEELKKYITDNFGDMKEYLMNQIEAAIYQLKR